MKEFEATRNRTVGRFVFRCPVPDTFARIGSEAARVPLEGTAFNNWAGEEHIIEVTNGSTHFPHNILYLVLLEIHFILQT